MKKGLLIVLVALVAVVAGFFIRGVLLEPRTIEMLSVSAPSENYDLAISAGLAQRLAAKNIPADSGIALTRLAFAGEDRIAAEAEISGEALSSLTGKLSGIVGAILPEQVVLAAQVQIALAEGKILVRPEEITVQGLSIPVGLLPGTLLRALEDAINSQIPQNYRPMRIYCADNVCYLLLAE